MTRFSIPHVPALALMLALAAGTVGCSRPADNTQKAAPAAPAAAPAAATQAADEPKYEPAYPTEVSAEGLTAKDTAQQAKPHSHDGGEEHAHGEKEKEGDHGHPH